MNWNHCAASSDNSAQSASAAWAYSFLSCSSRTADAVCSSNSNVTLEAICSCVTLSHLEKLANHPNGLASKSLRCPLGDFDLGSPLCFLGHQGHKERWAHNLRSGLGVPLPELGGENSESHCLIPLGPKETGLQLEYLDTHGLVDSLARLAS